MQETVKLNQCQGVWVEGLQASGAWDNSFDCVACQVGWQGGRLRWGGDKLRLQDAVPGSPNARRSPGRGQPGAVPSCILLLPSARCPCLCPQYGHILNSRFSDSEWGLYLKGGSGEPAASRHLCSHAAGR